MHHDGPPALQISWHSAELSSARVLINIDRGMVNRGLVTDSMILSSKNRLFDLLVLVTDSKRVTGTKKQNKTGKHQYNWYKGNLRHIVKHSGRRSAQITKVQITYKKNITLA